MNEMVFALQILIGLIIGKFKLLKWHITNLLSRFYEAVSQKNWVICIWQQRFHVKQTDLEMHAPINWP